MFNRYIAPKANAGAAHTRILEVVVQTVNVAPVEVMRFGPGGSGGLGGQGDSTYVLVVSNGRVAKQAVTVGPSDKATGQVAIAKGLEGGEKVIVTPSVQLPPGTPVVLASEEAAAPRETARPASGGS